MLGLLTARVTNCDIGKAEEKVSNWANQRYECGILVPLYLYLDYLIVS